MRISTQFIIINERIHFTTDLASMFLTKLLTNLIT